MAFTLDTTYTLYIENPEAAGTTLRVGNAGYTVTREGEEGNYSFSIALTSTGEVLYSGVKKIGLDQSEGTIKRMGDWECRKVEVLTKGNITTIDNSGRTNNSIIEIIDHGRILFINMLSLSYLKALKKATFPKVRTIGYGAFACNSSLEEIIISGFCQEIAAEAFGNCYNLKSITIERGSGSISLKTDSFTSGSTGTSYKNPFDRFSNNDDGRYLSNFKQFSTYQAIKILKNFTLGGQNYALAFKSTTLRKAEFQCEVINSYTCYQASSLSRLTLVDVQTIEKYAFAECLSLIEVTLPKTVTSIAEGVFSGCVCVITCTSAQAEMLTSAGFTGSFNIVDD